MWSPRAQSDRWRFSEAWRLALESNPLIDFFQDGVSSLLFDDQRVSGVVTNMGMSFNSKSVVLTTGTFLNGLIHIGRQNFGGGRMGEQASMGITEQLSEKGFTTEDPGPLQSLRSSNSIAATGCSKPTVVWPCCCSTYERSTKIEDSNAGYVLGWRARQSVKFLTHTSSMR